MALDFPGGAVTDKVNCGHGSSLANIAAGTVLVWAWIDATAQNGRFYAKAGPAPAPFAAQVTLANYAGGVAGRYSIQVNRATTQLNALVEKANMPTLDAAKWNFIGGVYNTAGVDGNQLLYCGDLATPVAVATTYVTQTVGSGTVGDDSGQDANIGNALTDDMGFNGKIAWIGVWNRVLSLGEIQAQQFHPHVTSGCKLFMHLGFNGTGTQADWSGNGNNGTVTGATVADHVPLGPLVWSAPRVPYVVAAPAAGNPWYAYVQQ